MVLGGSSTDRFGSQAALFRHSSPMSAFERIADGRMLLFRRLRIERLLSPKAVTQCLSSECLLSARTSRSSGVNSGPCLRPRLNFCFGEIRPAAMQSHSVAQQLSTRLAASGRQPSLVRGNRLLNGHSSASGTLVNNSKTGLSSL
jgi:hypothetical protein